MLTIYHNPRCSKSRIAVNFLEDLKLEFTTVKYLNETLSFDELTSLLEKLNYKPIELIRKNEAIWKSDFKDKNLSDKEIIEAMLAFPKLIERPIIVKGNKAIVARPIEKVKEIL